MIRTSEFVFIASGFRPGTMQFRDNVISSLAADNGGGVIRKNVLPVRCQTSSYLRSDNVRKLLVPQFLPPGGGLSSAPRTVGTFQKRTNTCYNGTWENWTSRRVLSLFVKYNEIRVEWNFPSLNLFDPSVFLTTKEPRHISFTLWLIYVTIILFAILIEFVPVLLQVFFYKLEIENFSSVFG